MKVSLVIFAAITLIACSCTSQGRSPDYKADVWMPDSLGEGFEMMYIRQPDDYSGAVRCTVVRHLTADSVATHRGVLYVHGYNDYFFQRELADSVAAWGYDFYAVDLRKYGRSIMAGQRKFEVRDLSEYFADIDSALAVMRKGGIDEVALMGHSTGGLITSYFMALQPPREVKMLVLNSPFLDWNLGSIEWLMPYVSKLGAFTPRLAFPQGSSTAYAESLLKRYHGEWDYNTEWKTVEPQSVQASWVRAIECAQQRLKNHTLAIHVPILLMASARSVSSDEWSPQYQQADGVLDADEITRIGSTLGSDVTPIRVDGGIHDLFLSPKAVRSALYPRLHTFLATHW